MTVNKELHYRYIISYLFGFIILLIALAYYDVPDLVDKFSFALTLSSLLLAVLAIFYTIWSAQKQGEQLTQLIETNTNIANAADDVKVAAEDIRLFAKEAPQHFQALGKKIDYISEQGFESMKSVFAQEVDQVPEKNSKIEIDSQQFATKFGELQFATMISLYLFKMAQRNDIEIELDKIEGMVSTNYFVGALSVFQSIGLVSYKLHKSAIVPVSCAKVVIDDLDTVLQRVLGA